MHLKSTGQPYKTTPERRAYRAAYAADHRDKINADARDRRQRERAAVEPIKALLKSAALVAIEAERQARKDARTLLRYQREREAAAARLGDKLVALRQRLEPKPPRVITAAQRARKHELQKQHRAAIKDAFVGPIKPSRRKLAAWKREQRKLLPKVPKTPKVPRIPRAPNAPKARKVTSAQFLIDFIGPPRPPKPPKASRAASAPKPAKLTRAQFLVEFVGPPKPPKAPRSAKVPKAVKPPKPAKPLSQRLLLAQHVAEFIGPPKPPKAPPVCKEPKQTRAQFMASFVGPLPRLRTPEEAAADTARYRQEMAAWQAQHGYARKNTFHRIADAEQERMARAAAPARAPDAMDSRRIKALAEAEAIRALMAPPVRVMRTPPTPTPPTPEDSQ